MGRVRTSNPDRDPDALDVCIMLNEIGVKFGLICRISIQYTVGAVMVIVQAGHSKRFGEFEVVYVAKNERKHQHASSRDAQVWATLWDIYTQADTGIEGARPRGVYKN